MLIMFFAIAGVFSVKAPLFVDSGPFISDHVLHGVQYDQTAENSAKYIKSKFFPDFELNWDDGFAMRTIADTHSNKYPNSWSTASTHIFNKNSFAENWVETMWEILTMDIKKRVI